MFTKLWDVVFWKMYIRNVWNIEFEDQGVPFKSYKIQNWNTKDLY